MAQNLLGNEYNSFYFEDSRGNTWISSGQGWNKFNGESTTQYVAGLDSGIKGEYVQSNLFEDENGDLWSSTFNYLIKYDSAKDLFESFQVTIDSNLINAGYYVFRLDRQRNTLWVKIDDEIVLIDLAELAKNHYPILKSKSRRYAASNVGDTTIFVGMPWQDGPGYETIKLHNYSFIEKSTFYTDSTSNLILRDGVILHDEFWGLSNLGLINFSLSTPSEYRILFPENFKDFTPNHLILDDSKILITSKGNGLWSFDLRNESFIQVGSKKTGLLSDSPLEIYKDSHEKIWLSFSRLGVQAIDLNKQRTFVKEYSESSQNVKKIFHAKNGNIIVIMLEAEVIILNNKEKNESSLDISSAKISLVADAKYEANDVLHLADLHRYAAFSLPGKRKINEKSISEGQFFYIDKTPNRTEFITSSKGVIDMPDQNKKTPSTNGKPFFLYRSVHGDVVFDEMQNYSISSLDTSIYLGKQGWPVQVAIDSIHKIIMATKQGLFEIMDEKISPLFKSGLELDDIRGFGYDEYRNLWFTRTKNIYVYTSDSTLIRIPSEHDVEFSNSAPIFPDDEVWFATNKGVLTVEKDIYKHYQEVPHTYVMEVHINGLKYDSPLNPDYIENMDLTWLENDLNFRTEVGEYTGDGHQSIKYRLTGLETEWIYSSDFNLSYKNLQPGNYTLEMIGIGSNLRESELKKLDINISAPYYQTWWFRGLVAGTLVLIGFGINYFRTKKKLRDQEIVIEKQKALQNQRNRMAQDLHDEMGSGLTSIKYISNALKKERESEKIDQIENTSTNLIGSMRDMLWSLDESNDTLGSLVSKSRTSIHRMCKSTNLKYEIETDLDSEIPIPGIYRRNIILILKEAITNVIKHADAKLLNIHFSADQRNLLLQISDDGKGIIDKSNNEKPYGIRSMQNRVEEMKGSFEFMPEYNGTFIKIIIPLIKDA